MNGKIMRGRGADAHFRTPLTGLSILRRAVSGEEHVDRADDAAVALCECDGCAETALEIAHALAHRDELLGGKLRVGDRQVAELAGAGEWVGIRPYKAPQEVQDLVFWRTYWKGKGKHHWSAIHALTIGAKVKDCK